MQHDLLNVDDTANVQDFCFHVPPHVPVVPLASTDRTVHATRSSVDHMKPQPKIATKEFPISLCDQDCAPFHPHRMCIEWMSPGSGTTSVNDENTGPLLQHPGVLEACSRLTA